MCVLLVVRAPPGGAGARRPVDFDAVFEHRVFSLQPPCFLCLSLHPRRAPPLSARSMLWTLFSACLLVVRVVTGGACALRPSFIDAVFEHRVFALRSLYSPSFRPTCAARRSNHLEVCTGHLWVHACLWCGLLLVVLRLCAWLIFMLFFAPCFVAVLPHFLCLSDRPRRAPPSSIKPIWWPSNRLAQASAGVDSSHRGRCRACMCYSRSLCSRSPNVLYFQFSLA